MKKIDSPTTNPHDPAVQVTDPIEAATESTESPTEPEASTTQPADDMPTTEPTTEPAAPTTSPETPPAPAPSAPAAPVPSPGRIVHYRLLITEQIRPAMIVTVHSDELVDVQVFTNGEADKRAIGERVVMLNVNNGAEHHQVPSLVNRSQVAMGDEPGQWSWPTRT